MIMRPSKTVAEATIHCASKNKTKRPRSRQGPKGNSFHRGIITPTTARRTKHFKKNTSCLSPPHTTDCTMMNKEDDKIVEPQPALASKDTMSSSSSSSTSVPCSFVLHAPLPQRTTGITRRSSSYNQKSTNAQECIGDRTTFQQTIAFKSKKSHSLSPAKLNTSSSDANASTMDDNYDRSGGHDKENTNSTVLFDYLCDEEEYYNHDDDPTAAILMTPKHQIITSLPTSPPPLVVTRQTRRKQIQDPFFVLSRRRRRRDDDDAASGISEEDDDDDLLRGPLLLFQDEEEEQEDWWCPTLPASSSSIEMRTAATTTTRLLLQPRRSFE